MLRFLIALLVALAVAGSVTLATADHHDDAAPTTVASLAWMSGTWVQESENEYAECTYTTPHSGEMLGVFRWSRDGKLIVYELLALQDTDTGVRVLMRHFSEGLTPWESEADGPLVYEATRTGKNSVLFEKIATPDDPRAVRIEYTRSGDSMTANVDTGTGKPFTIRYTRRTL